jgi:RimJ/RimL family protein N-acetyltransferase
MIDAAVFENEQIRLVAVDPERAAPLFARWGRDAEYARQLDSEPPRLWSAKAIQEWIKKEQEKGSLRDLVFLIESVKEDKPIGFVALDGIQWSHGEAWLGIGIGERASRGQGLGTEAVRLVLRYAFTELNLHRVSLSVFEYNPRALRAYEKAGFRVEGRARGALKRDGRRWDLVFMGILVEEWISTDPQIR